MIELVGVDKSYGDKPIFRELSLSFATGAHAIMGASGVGKTTLISLIAGLTTPDAGRITGIDPNTLSMVFQEDRLIEHATVLDNVLLPVTKTHTPHALKLLARCELSQAVNEPVRALSGGMKRRVALCRALIRPFDTLILDEPFKGLDNTTKRLAMDVVRDCTQHKTLLLVTHDVTEANYLNANVIDLG